MCLGLRPASLFSLWVFARPCASSPSMDLTSIGCVERRVPARRFRRWFRSRRQLRLRPTFRGRRWAPRAPPALEGSFRIRASAVCVARVPARRFLRWFRGRWQLRLRESDVPGATVGASCPARPRGFTSRPGFGRSCDTRSCAAISSVVPWSLAASAPRRARHGSCQARPAVSRDTVAFRLGTRGYSGVCVWTHDLSGGPASVHLLQPPCLLDRPAYYRMIYTPRVLHSQYTGTDRTEG